MNKPKLSFKTKRLSIDELDNSSTQVHARLCATMQPEVTTHLPNNFQGIKQPKQACDWLNNLMQHSIVKGIYTEQLIGIVVLYPDKATLHLGYFLAKESWRKGYGSELIEGLIAHLRQSKKWRQLNAGVTSTNYASQSLLEKNGFKLQTKNQDMLSYTLEL